MSILYLVGVPIGNWQDITFRAIETLKNVDIIAAEDTRKAKKLLNNFSIIPKRLIAHHNANEQTSTEGVIQLLQEGNSIAFISDAGMPGISDPGFLLSRTVIKNNIEVKIVPGVSAVTTAVVISGLPCDRFFFQGFLPRQATKQKQRLTELNSYAETLVFYESPRRILDTLKNMIEIFGEDRKACLCRELTKIHEEVIRLSLADLHEFLISKDAILGEIAIVVEGKQKEKMQDVDINDYIKKQITAKVQPKIIKKDIAKKLNISAADAYKMIVELSKE